MKYCPSCGSELDENARFCVNCGHDQSKVINTVTSESGVEGASKADTGSLDVSASPESSSGVGRRPGWKTSIGMSILGVIAGYAAASIIGFVSFVGLESFITSQAEDAPIAALIASIAVLAVYAAVLAFYLLKLYPRYFSGKKEPSGLVVSFANCLFGGIIFGPIWNSNITKGKKGISHIVISAITILAVVSCGVFFAFFAYNDTTRYDGYRRHIESIAQDLTVDTEEGDIVKFGQYPTSANGDRKDILWSVVDKKGNSVTLISVFALDAKQYEDDENYQYSMAGFPSSDLGKWLNSDFRNIAFADHENNRLEKMSIANGAGKVKVGLTTEKLLNQDTFRPATFPTPYAISKGARHDGIKSAALRSDEMYGITQYWVLCETANTIWRSSRAAWAVTKKASVVPLITVNVKGLKDLRPVKK